MGKAYEDKWKKFKILEKSPFLAGKLPHTKEMNPRNLWEMVDRYQQVILKPMVGKGGEGVIAVSKGNHGNYHVHVEKQQKQIRGKKKTYRYIKSRMISSSYMVQQRIALATVNDRPLDLRVTVQRKKNSSWRVTGKLAKVAGKGYIVTNFFRSRGKIIPIESAIRQSSLRSFSCTDLISRIEKIALEAAKQLSRSFPWLRTVGMDMALDSKGKVWIIEANFTPNHTLFLRLKDHSMYHTILSYEKK